MTLLLTIGTEYNGSMYLYHNAEKSADLFETAFIKRTKCTSIKLRGSECNATNIINKIHELSTRTDLDMIIIYYAGHGDHYSNKEFWKTSSGNVDQIKIASLINELTPLVVVVSEACSSEHMVNAKFAKHPYISIGSTLDYQDAIMTGDGGLFTMALVECINELNNDAKFIDLMILLNSKKVEIETFSFLTSSNDVLMNKVFI